MTGHAIVSLAIALGALAGAPARQAAPSPENAVVSEFMTRVKEYVDLHKMLESKLPRFPKEATPAQIEERQAGFTLLIKAARHGAKPGEFFTPAMEEHVRRILADVLSGPDGKTIKSSIMDENPGMPEILVNERYPSAVPVSTMPPQVLSRLPELDKLLEFRFIGPRMVLVDTDADVILDFTKEVLPK